MTPPRSCCAYTRATGDLCPYHSFVLVIFSPLQGPPPYYASQTQAVCRSSQSCIGQIIHWQMAYEMADRPFLVIPARIPSTDEAFDQNGVRYDFPGFLRTGRG